MTKPRGKATATPRSPHPEISPTVGGSPDEALRILWGIARDPGQSATARVNACRLLLMDARERDDGVEIRHDADLHRRALKLMRQVAN